MDYFFFFIFSITSMLIWLPILGLLYVPFHLLRQLKRAVCSLAQWLSEMSELGLGRLVYFHQLVKAVRLLENKSKGGFNDFVHKIYKKTVWWTRFEILQAVPEGAKVLDIGCGNGYLAQLVAQARRADVTCVDVVDYNETELKTVIFDGVNLPFADKSFDVVILSYVLHHSQVPKDLLAEAERVCRGKVIIYEDDVPLFKGIMAKLHEVTYNWMYDIDSQVTYRTIKEWEKMFVQTGFLVEQRKSEWQVGALTKPVKKVIYVLKPRRG